MRLGKHACELKNGTKIAKIYNSKLIYERHRHKYEFNNRYLEEFEKNGFIRSGFNPDANITEIFELKSDNQWYIGVQFHPEYRSTVLSPHPLFVDFIKNAINS